MFNKVILIYTVIVNKKDEEIRKRTENGINSKLCSPNWRQRG